MPGTLRPRRWDADPTLGAPARFRRACKYDAFVPMELAHLDLLLDAGIAGTVSEAEHAIRDLNTTGASDLAAMARLLLRSESIASSRIEGIQLGARELARAEVRMNAGGRVTDTARDVIGNIDAMMLAVDRASRVRTFDESEILEIHATLLARATNRHIAGRFRTQQNWIGGNDYNPCGADFVPPPPEDLSRLLMDLCAAINDDGLPPIVQAALVHAQFETIHPFDDGNGRTGRALIQVVLRRRGLATHYVPPISLAFAAARRRYIDGLTGFRGDDVQAWIEYFAAAATRASRLASTHVTAARALCDRWREQLKASDRAPRADAAAWRLIDALPGHPVITAAIASEAIHRSRPQVHAAIEQLQAAGILIPLSENRRNMAWEATGLLDLIVQLEAGVTTASLA